ncbi:hypothetical protein BGZ89_005064 [Linnemannia elongata]|nr:hypothetical protein BGZ89_005064 [Linnemannia elongata]
MRGESKPDDCTDDARDIDDFADQEQLADSDSDEEDTDIKSDISDRKGLKFKSALFQKFSALFDEFGNPQLFGTFSCDDKSAGQVVPPTFLPSRL